MSAKDEEKRIVAVNDISCAGRCSLTVILPVISAAGIECSVIPTAVLSTHTGEFSGYTFKNLAEDILPIAEHWKKLERKYDGIYTGYFGSEQQIDMAMKIPEIIGKGPETILMVDPVMADAGELYKNFDASFVEKMKVYIKIADIITPNMTEAALLLDEEYDGGPHDISKIRSMLEKLTDMGPEIAVITGVTDGKGTGCAYYDSKTGEFGTVLRKTLPGRYYGTGDLFASALFAARMKGIKLKKACKIAVALVYESIKRTHALNTDVRYGVEFEKYLVRFARKL